MKIEDPLIGKTATARAKERRLPLYGVLFGGIAGMFAGAAIGPVAVAIGGVIGFLVGLHKETNLMKEYRMQAIRRQRELEE